MDLVNIEFTPVMKTGEDIALHRVGVVGLQLLKVAVASEVLGDSVGFGGVGREVEFARESVSENPH